MLGEEATELFEGARATLARFFGAPAPETIVFTRGVTESMNLVAQGWGRKFLARGRRDPAHRDGAPLQHRPVADDGGRHRARRSATSRSPTTGSSTSPTSARCSPSARRSSRVTGMSNALGTITPLRQLVDAAHAVGAVVAVDAAQLAPHHAIDVHGARRATSSAFSGHKMLGPTAVGRPLRQGRDPRGDGPDDRRRRDDPRGLPRPQHLQAGAVQVRGRHDADRPAGRAGRGRRLPGGARAWTPCAPTRRRSPRYALDRLIDAGATVFGPKDASDARGSGELLVQGRAPARPGHDPERRGRRDPGGPPLRAARDAALRRARHGAGVVLRLQHQGRGRRPGRVRSPRPRRSSV